jgi:hypothetical protein
MPFTTYFDQRLISLAIGQTAYVIPASFYVGLSSTPPSQIQAGSPVWGFTEPAGNSYARVAVPNDGVHWGPVTVQPPTGYSLQNKLIVTYLQSSGPWAGGVNLPFFGVFDALTGGNLLFFGNCSPAQAVAAANVTLSFAAGALTTTIN